MNKKIQAARNECVNLSKIEKNIYKNINSVALIILNFPHFFFKSYVPLKRFCILQVSVKTDVSKLTCCM